MNQRSYFIPAQACETTYEIKKSRFIARLAYANSREQAMSLLAQAKQDYPDARHHCWAYQIGSPASPSLAAMSDDGEPSGTAGKPILNVIQHKELGDLMLIVIRYFGGIKLGAGGLVRAYSRAAQQVFEEVETREQQFKLDCVIECPFATEQHIRHWMMNHEGEVLDGRYASKVFLQCKLPESELKALQDFLAHQPDCRLSLDD